MPIEAEQFKRTLAQWASGVTIVTAREGDRAHGMTVSSFCSVSLDPPLVLICAEKISDTHGVIREGGVFTVNVLAEGQEELSNKFARSKDEHLRFEGLDCKIGVSGCPHIPGAVATLDCRVVRGIDSGDHIIYIGEVEEVDTSDRRPLLYYRSTYHRLEG